LPTLLGNDVGVGIVFNPIYKSREGDIFSKTFLTIRVVDEVEGKVFVLGSE